MKPGLIKWLIQLVLPTRCAACHRVGPDTLCDNCRAGLEEVGAAHCLRCGRRRETTFASPDCGECFGRRLGVSRARSLLIYNATGRELLAQFKFNGNLGAGEALLELLARWLGAGAAGLYDEPGCAFDAVVPVPLHPRRLRKRRFNQAEQIAARAAREFKLSCRPELLQRVRETPSQVGLSANQRQLNVRGAFAVPERMRAPLSGKRVLLVDDLMTTGATLGACAVALRKGGSGPVYALTLFSTHLRVEAALSPVGASHGSPGSS